MTNVRHSHENKALSPLGSLHPLGQTDPQLLFPVQWESTTLINLFACCLGSTIVSRVSESIWRLMTKGPAACRFHNAETFQPKARPVISRATVGLPDPCSERAAATAACLVEPIPCSARSIWWNPAGIMDKTGAPVNQAVSSLFIIASFVCSGRGDTCVTPRFLCVIWTDISCCLLRK